MNKSWKKNRTVECIVHVATWALVRFGLGVKGPEYLMTHQGWENWGNQWMNGMSLKRSKGDCRRREMNCLKATVRNEITNTWDVREWEGCGGSATFLEQPTSDQKSDESCVCWLACLFLHVPILRHSVTVAAPKSSWPLRAPLEGHSQIFRKRLFPWSRPKEMTFCLNHLSLLLWVLTLLKLWKPHSQNYPSLFMPLSESPHICPWLNLEVRFSFP